MELSAVPPAAGAALPGDNSLKGGVNMTTCELVGTLASLHRRLRTISTYYDGLENQIEARNVFQAALSELSAMHNLLPEHLREKSWVFLSLERGSTHWRS